MVRLRLWLLRLRVLPMLWGVRRLLLRLLLVLWVLRRLLRALQQVLLLL